MASRVRRPIGEGMIPDPIGGPYDVVLADPPWRYEFSKSKSRRIENQYETMTQTAICAITIPTTKDAVLYLWATAPKLPEALEVMRAWGFQYKTMAVWDKEIIGMGYWFRGQHELLIVGVKGKFSPPPTSLRVSSIIRARRTNHSSKPPLVRDLIASWFPGARRLEMFARDGVHGWDAWGSEIQAGAAAAQQEKE